MQGYAFFDCDQRVTVVALDEEIRRTKRLCERLSGRTGVIRGSHSSPLFANYLVEIEAAGRKRPFDAWLAEHEIAVADGGDG